MKNNFYFNHKIIYKMVTIYEDEDPVKIVILEDDEIILATPPIRKKCVIPSCKNVGR